VAPTRQGQTAIGVASAMIARTMSGGQDFDVAYPVQGPVQVQE
jgi:hypothetical protein